jgi:hypothetical protein
MALKALTSPRRAALALALAGAFFAFGAGADDTAPTAPTAPTAATAHPDRGARMTAVEQHFGAPATRYPAVGQPPITRWDYPNMVVFFENDRVIHTVLVTPAG